ncbi:hypothetical protein ACEPAG_2007 [Sanghuangporus baumii]
MVAPIHQTGGPLLPPTGSQSSVGSIPNSADSGAVNHPNQNAVSTNHTNGRVHPPLQERSRNARAQARHRAKRKAYISQLEETVARLQAALSPSPYALGTTPGIGVNGNANANPNDQPHSSFGNSPSAPANTSSNAVINLGPPSAAVAGQGSAGLDGTNLVARLRALELECQVLRAHAENLRNLLAQHAPTVQLPPVPLPSSLPPSASATSSGPSSVHSNSSSGPGGALPSLNSSFPALSSASTTPTGPTSLSPGTYRIDPAGKLVGIKRPRHDSHSRSASDSGSGPEREPDDNLEFTAESGGNVSYSAPKMLSGKSDAFNTPVHTNFLMSGLNSASAGGRPPPLTLPPVPQSQPGPPAHLTNAHANNHPMPMSVYPLLGSNQSQQSLPSPSHQHQQQQHHSQQPQSQAHAHTHTQPQMTPMPPPVPHWGVAGGVSSVPSHGNNNAPVHGLQLPPPIPRFPGAAMPNLTRGFVYQTNGSSAGARADGMDSSTNADRSRIGSLGGGGIGPGLTGTGNGMPLKREEDSESGLATNINMYGFVGAESAYTYTQIPRHTSGRHQQHESIHSISPISATAASPSTAIPQHQEHYHSQITSPHGPQHNYQQHQQSPATQRPLASPASQQQHPSQGHYSQHSNAAAPSPAQNTHALHQPLVPQQQTQTQPHPHQHHHQQNATTLPSPHSPYPPISPSISGPFRGYPEERSYHQSGPQQHAPSNAHAHHQNQNQSQSQSQNHDQNYLWNSVHAGGVYGGR